jgi:hypothetical protein
MVNEFTKVTNKTSSKLIFAICINLIRIETLKKRDARFLTSLRDQL